MNSEPYDLDTAIERAESIEQKKKKERVKASLLHLFFPLDIDMQAVEKLKDKKIIKEYLTDMLRNRPVNYKEKLEEAQKKVNEMPEFKDNPILKGLLSKISGFLELLDTTNQKVKNGDITDNEMNSIITYFSKNGGWNISGAKPEEIKSFRNWYCALAKCLRGERHVIKTMTKG